MVAIATVEKQLDVRPDRSADRPGEIDCSPKLSKIFPNSPLDSNCTPYCRLGGFTLWTDNDDNYGISHTLPPAMKIN